jgi:3-hydroxyisobutyrate dehydrogenase-like beta-hydroxyacid dehydrogenase
MARIGFIGLGNMGGPIAMRMARRGLPMLVHDSNPAAQAQAVAAGCEAAESVRDVADQCEIVFACLPTAEVCQAVALGPRGIAGGGKIKIYVETSTFGAVVAETMAAGLAAVGITLLDAPVVGAVMALERDTLGVLLAGPKTAFEIARPCIESFAGKIFYLGDTAGMAQVGKVMSNAVSYATLIATCEALAMGMKGGIDPSLALDIINQGSGMNFFSSVVAPNYLLKGRFTGTGSIQIGCKDVKLFLEEAAKLQSPAPVAAAIALIQKTIVASGPADRDTMTYIHYFTDLAGIPRLPETPSAG